MAVNAQTIQKAREAGYSDDELKQYIASSPEYAKAKKAGYSDDEIHVHLGMTNPQEQQPGEQLPQPADTWAGDPAAPGGSVNLQPQAPLQIKQQVPAWKQNLSLYSRPVLEGLGMVGGAIAAAPANVVAPGLAEVAGAGLGYAGGKKLADLLDQGLGLQQAPKTLGQATAQTLGDVVNGAAMEMGGQTLGWLVGGGASAVKNAMTPFRDSVIKGEAGKILSNAYGGMSPLEEAALARSAKLEKSLGINGTLTRAQQTGNMKAGMFEQSMAAGDGQLANNLAQREAGAVQTALTNVKNTLGNGKQLPKTTSPQQTGENVYNAINRALVPVKQMERTVWAQVPDYPMPTDGLSGAIKTVTASPLDEETTNAVQSAIRFIDGTPKTTKGLQAIEQTLSSDITSALRAGKNKVARPLIELKNGIRADFDAMGEAAANGDVGLHGGNVVFPSKLKAEMDGIDQVLSRGMTDQSAAQQLLAKKKSLPLPRVFLTLVSAYSVAKRFSKEQKFDRFGRGQTKNVLSVGNEFEGTKLPFEQIPGRFYSPSGVDDLVRAIGKANATAQMRPHVVSDLLAKTTDADGNMGVLKAWQYMNKNRVVLDKLGMTNEVKEIVKGQLPQEFERIRSTKRVGKIDELPYFTTQESRTLLQKYGNILKSTYGPKSVAALRDYHGLMQALSRNKNISYAGGSNTYEKLVNNPELLPPPAQRVVNSVIDGMATALGAGAGWVADGAMGAVAGGAMVGGARKAYSTVHAIAKEKTMQLLKDAIMNPEMADALMRLSRIKPSAARSSKNTALVRRLVTGYVAGMASTPDIENDVQQ